MPKKHPNDIREAARECYKAGATCSEIARRLDVKERTIRQWTQDLRQYQRQLPETIRDAVLEYWNANPGLKLRTVAKRFKIGTTTVWRIVKDSSTRYSRMDAAVKAFKSNPYARQIDVARAFSVHKDALCHRLKRDNIKRALICDKLRRMHSNHPEWSKKQLARVCGCAVSTVRYVFRGQQLPNDIPDYSAVATVNLDHAYEIDAKEPPKKFERGVAPLRLPPLFMRQYVKVYREAREVRKLFTNDVRDVCERIKRGELSREKFAREYRIGMQCGFFERRANSTWDLIGKH